MPDEKDREAGRSGNPDREPEAVPDPAVVGRLAHRMNNAVAFVLTNLTRLAEELDGDPPSDPNRRRAQLVVEATTGIDRLGDLIRELRVLSWSDSSPFEEGQDDTWDEERRP